MSKLNSTQVDGGGGVSTFTGLTDTPSSYPSGSAGKSAVVNLGEDGLEFADVEGTLTPEQQATLLYFRYNDSTDKLEASKSIETILASIFLGGQHKITSGGENTFTKNLTSDVNYSPSWSGIKDQSIVANQDSTGIIPLTSRIPEDNLQSIEPDGPIGTNIIDYASDASFVNNTGLYGVRFRLGQSLSIGNILSYNLYLGSDNTGVKIFESSEVITTSKASGDFFDFWYGTPVEVFGGTTVYAEIMVEESQNSGIFSTLQVYSTNVDPNERYTLVRIREFEDVPVMTQTDLSQRQIIRSGLVTDFTVTPVASDTQVRITPVGSSIKYFFNTDPDIETRGVFVETPQRFIVVPNDPIVKKYYTHVTTGGFYGTTEDKIPSDTLDKIHVYEFIAQNGALEPESLIANPFLSWTDKTIQGILDTDGIRLDDLEVTSPNNGTLQIQSTDFDILGNSINYAISKVNPHVKAVPGATPLFWTYLAQSSVGIPPIGGNNALITNQWDNGGVLQAVPVNQATVQRLMIIGDGQFLMLYGQQLFANYDDALLNQASVEYVLPPSLFDAVEVARIIIKSGATDSADTNEITIQNTAGIAGGGSGQVPQSGEFFDADFILKNSVDPSKLARFDCQDIKTGTQPTFRYPPQEGQLALRQDAIYDLVTATKQLESHETFTLVDSSSGSVKLTLPNDPEIGQKHLFWVEDNSNPIDVVSDDPNAPLGTPVVVQPDKLQGQWVLNADLNDSSPKGRNLVNKDTGGFFEPHIINGRQVDMYDLEFSQWLDSPGYTGILGTAPRTFTCWYASNHIGPPTSVQYLTSWGSDDSGGGIWWRVILDGTNGRLNIDIKNAQRRYAWASIPELLGIFDGQPHHIAITQSGVNVKNIRVFIDGVEIFHTAQDTSPTMNTQPEYDFRLGTGLGAAPTNRLNASLYDVRLWDTALSQLEVDTVRTELIGGGINIAALDNQTVIEFTFDGAKWIAATAVFERILQLYQEVTGLAVVAKTGDYNDLLNRPEVGVIDETGVLVPSDTRWYRVSSTEDGAFPHINAQYDISTKLGRYHTTQFSLSYNLRDEHRKPSFSLLSNHPANTATAIKAIRIVADNVDTANERVHVDVQISEGASPGEVIGVIHSRGILDNQSSGEFLLQADVPTPPARVMKVWEIDNLKNSLSDDLTITESGHVNYGATNGPIPKADLNNLPFSMLIQQQVGTQLTREANAPVTVGSFLSDSILNTSGLINWLSTGTGYRELYNNVVGSNTIFDVVQTGINQHVFKINKTGWYECTLDMNFGTGSDGPNYTAHIFLLDSGNFIVKELGISEVAGLDRTQATFKFSGWFEEDQRFTLVKTSGSGINSELIGRNARYEFKFIGDLL